MKKIIGFSCSMFLFLVCFTVGCTNEETILPQVKGIVTDIDGNVYRTITIGTQTWMVDNLRTTRYNNGDTINVTYSGDTTFSVFLSEPAKADTLQVTYLNNTITVVSKKKRKTISTYDLGSIYIMTTDSSVFRINRHCYRFDARPNENWSALIVGAHCTYELTTNEDSIAKYGRLYNLYAATDDRNVAPQGWHVPTGADWITLQNYVSEHLGTSVSYSKALADTSKWTVSSITGAVGNDLLLNNSSGFSALPCGYRSSNGLFTGIGVNASWWSTSAALYSGSYWYMGLINIYEDALWSVNNNLNGLSIRCVMDTE
jgi:uncharacterized protein (TIGR02145 family)